MKVIVKMLFGSRVYGTNVPESDTDYKQIFLPSFEDLALFRVKQIVSQSSTSGKNTSEDVDIESIELGRFLNLCINGQTNAIDMLFTPEQFLIESSQTWEKLIELRPKLLSSKIHAMVGYCKNQASKYSIKGVRLNSAKAVLDCFETLPEDDRLENHRDRLLSLCDLEYVKMSRINVGTGGPTEIDSLCVCGKHLPITTTIGYCISSTLRPMYEEYGKRTHAAANASGTDYKAMMHALRVSGEAIELMQTGHIEFPLREAPYLLRVRKGEVLFGELSEEIDNRLVQLTSAVERSNLPAEVDRAPVDKFILETYRDHFEKDFGRAK
jgi:hypothetical protein